MVEHVVVAGLSMGGAIAQYLAATSDRIERAVFASTATFLGGATGSLASGASGGSLRITSKDVAGTLDNAGFSFVVLRTG